MRKYLLPFGWSNVTRLALVMLLSNLYFYLPVATLYLQSKGLNYVQINSLWAIIVGTMFLAEVPTGLLADRMGRARSVQMALALQVVGEVIFLFAPNYLAFLAAAVAGGIGFAFSSGSAQALVYDSLLRRGEEQEMSRAMGFISAAKGAGNLVAFGLASLLFVSLSTARFQQAIALTAIMVFGGWLVSLTLRDAEAQLLDEDTPGTLAILRTAFATLRTNRRFLHLILLALATIPFVDYLLNLYQPRFVEVGVAPSWLGLSLAAAALVGIAAARSAYWVEKRLGAVRSLLLVTALPGALYLLFAAAQEPMAAVPLFCLLFGVMSMKEPLFSGHLNRHIASSHRATLLSLINMASGVYVAIMGLVIGRIADLSLVYAFLFMGGIVLSGALVFRVRNG